MKKYKLYYSFNEEKKNFFFFKNIFQTKIKLYL